MRVVIHREARAELRVAAQRYGDQTAELQLRFEESIKACVDRVATSPQHFPLINGRYRRALVEVFPYGIFFELLQAKIKILAIAHSSREPFYWIKRE